MYRVTVQLSEEKLAAIRALFAHNDWDWDPEVEEEVPATTSDIRFRATSDIRFRATSDIRFRAESYYSSPTIVGRMPGLPLSAMCYSGRQQTILVARPAEIGIPDMAEKICTRNSGR